MPVFRMAKKLEYGMMYYFKYNNPSTKKLTWDTSPIGIPLLITNKHLLMINLHWVPARMRNKFIQMVLTMSEQVKKRGRIKYLVRVYYDVVKRSMPFAVAGIRKYHLNRITNIQEIPPEFWSNVQHSDGRYKKRTKTR